MNPQSIEQLRAQASELRCQAQLYEDEGAVWAEREASLAGNVAYFLNVRDEASAEVFEERRRTAEAEWLRFSRMGEDCRRKASDIEAEVRKLRGLAFVTDAIRAA